MSRLFRILAVLTACILLAPALRAEGPSALARLDASRSALVSEGEGMALSLVLSQPVPWRAFTLADPPRLVLDFREVDWRGAGIAWLLQTERAAAIRTGAFQPGWSRMVVDLEGPYAIDRAGMTADEGGGATVTVRLAPVDDATFRAASGAPEGALWARPGESPRPAEDDRPTVVLDPGHGGIDPGAEADGVTEAALMLTFAREVQDRLVRAGYRVVLTRTEDVFVPLDARITIARQAGADLFLSLHADAVAQGRATGATVYTLSDTASDEASAALAERHDRADLLAGVDLSDQDDVIAGVLMDIARLDTQPRSEALADAVVAGLKASVGGLHRRPRLAAGFSVLRSPDIPSALVELGFISSEEDRERLTSAEWRGRAADGIVAAVETWMREDKALAGLRRR